MDFPLTPGRAVAIAAVLDAHPRRLAHWADWSRDLRTWAAENEPEPCNAGINTTDSAEVAPTEPGPELEVLADAPRPVGGRIDPPLTVDSSGMPVVDLVAALRASVEAAKARRDAEELSRSAAGDPS